MMANGHGFLWLWNFNVELKVKWAAKSMVWQRKCYTFQFIKDARPHAYVMNDINRKTWPNKRWLIVVKIDMECLITGRHEDLGMPHA